LCKHRQVNAQAFWDRSSAAQKWLHGVLAVWVCGNIFFNYAMGILTLPGSTLNASVEVRLRFRHEAQCFCVGGPLQRWDFA
jgi:hypothetical protein